MYDSGIKAKTLIDEIKAEMDIVPIITDSSFVRWLNTVEQTVYTEIIKELRSVSITSNLTAPIPMRAILPSMDEEQPIFDDIYKVYADNTELIKESIVGGYVFRLNGYWKNGVTLCYELQDASTPNKLTILYLVRPKRKTVSASGISDENVMLPHEFLDLVICRLRGEAYKLANEDAIAYKWLNDYNLAIENFKVWMAHRNVIYGE